MDNNILRAENIPGFMSRDELKAIQELASSMEPGSIWVEIGCLCGRSLLITALSLPATSTLVSVDKFWGGAISSGITAHDVYREIVMDSRIDIITMRTNLQSAATFFREKSIDVVFLDADHSYAATDLAIKTWRPKIRNGGWFAGHDYSDSWPGVKQAVNEHDMNKNIVGSFWKAQIW